MDFLGPVHLDGALFSFRTVVSKALYLGIAIPEEDFHS